MPTLEPIPSPLHNVYLSPPLSLPSHLLLQPSLSERFEQTAEPGDAEPEDAVLGDFCTSELCFIMVGQLTITDLTSSDAATYSCKASIDIQLTAAANAIVDVPYTLSVNEGICLGSLSHGLF